MAAFDCLNNFSSRTKGFPEVYKDLQELKSVSQRLTFKGLARIKKIIILI
jgi:hypothetical protein